jgi:vacuolar-type H+-ATPase subunit D/Vma8
LFLCRAFYKKTKMIQQGDFFYADSALIKVESFIGNEVNPVIDKEDVMGSINIKNLKSVMLTPTILKTIGFEKNPNNRYVLYSGIYVVEAYFNKVKDSFDLIIRIPTREEEISLSIQELNRLKRLLEALEIRANWDALESI